MPDSGDISNVEAAAARRLRMEVDDRARAASEEATRLAVETALRNAKIDSRLTNAETHLRAINGSQVEMVKTQREMKDTLDGVVYAMDTTKVAHATMAIKQEEMKIVLDDAVSTMHANAQVTQALKDKGLSSRAFYFGIATIFLMAASLIASRI